MGHNVVKPLRVTPNMYMYTYFSCMGFISVSNSKKLQSMFTTDRSYDTCKRKTKANLDLHPLSVLPQNLDTKGLPTIDRLRVTHRTANNTFLLSLIEKGNKK